MVLHNPNNWHWVNKDVSVWAREYLEKRLVGLDAQKDGVSAMLTKVVSMEGDVDVSQRKGKVITLFDVNLKLEYSGSCPDEDDVSGSINIPEVAHDTEEDEYVFEIDIYSDSNLRQPVKELVRRDLVPQLRKQLVKLGPALVAEHGKDLQHVAPTGSPSGSPAPLQTTSSSTAAQTNAKPSGSATTVTTPAQKGPSVNVTTVTDTEEFRTTAAELYQTFTDPQRIAAFTRSPPKSFEGAKIGGKFELFGGNVAGEYIELDEPNTIVQKWRLMQWPAGHYSTLKISFDQNNQDAVTVMQVHWNGVPIGQEEVTKRNWGEYYVRSIKTTFG
ncbi:MAG: hypothetical protein M1837_004241 [Sclerophora amabilis]|nr:MAG: hypothetical protein M1837_004241 [Sclerophora amabilis]